MMKNDYRRSLIMLRSHEQGYSGHVRLERRTLVGSMYVVINTPTSSGTLCAALVLKNAQGAYAAAKLGALRRDSRGQASLAYSFDPRNIGGRALEDYWLIAIVHTDDAGACEVVLSGNVNGSRNVEWNGVRAAACEACREGRQPACEFCPQAVEEREENPDEAGEAQKRDRRRTSEAGADDDKWQRWNAEGDEDSREENEEDEERNRQNRRRSDEDEEDKEEEEEQDRRKRERSGERDQSGGSFRYDGRGNAGSTDSDEVISQPPADDLPEKRNVSAKAVIAPAQATAAEVLGLDPNIPWPGVAEQVRQFFVAQPPKELMLNDGYVYVSAPMPERSGYDHAEVGLKVEEGLPVTMAYALPSRYTPEPPPGLENYTWKGGASDGWWTIQTDVYTGERLT